MQACQNTGFVRAVLLKPDRQPSERIQEDHGQPNCLRWRLRLRVASALSTRQCTHSRIKAEMFVFFIICAIIWPGSIILLFYPLETMADAAGAPAEGGEVQDLTAYVQTLLQQMQDKFQGN